MSALRKPLIIPYFIPQMGCPHQCIFCNQSAITSTKKSDVLLDALEQVVLEYQAYRGGRDQVQLAFYGGTFLGLEAPAIRSYLENAARFVDRGLIDGIRFSTRPDTITVETLELLKGFPVDVIELGLQSMDDRVLELSRRGHTAAQTEKAVDLLKLFGCDIGLQMMIGLPGDSRDKALMTGLKIASLHPSFVRIYPTAVFRGSPLASIYRNGDYLPLGLDEAVRLAADLYLIFYKESIKVIRTGLQASTDFEDERTLVAGPYHPAFGHLVFSRLFLDMAEMTLSSSEKTDAYPGKERLIIRVHPRSISRMRGIRNANTIFLKARYGFRQVDVIPDTGLSMESIGMGDAITHMAHLSL